MKVLVALSGGVDSTVAALRLQKQGYELIGCYMFLHGSLDEHQENIQKVKKVADFLGISYEVLDLSDRFKKQVYEPFVQTYKKGKTPNPCVTCNKNIKFGALVDFAKSLNCDRLATGHYVRVVDGAICEAKDKSKDQSYFLANVQKDAIAYMLFPLGESLKEEVKEEARDIKELNLFASQKESSEICFVPDTYVDILRKYEDVDKKGEVVDKDGKVIGTHQGYMHYTIGKRRGFEVKGAHEPHYVLGINSQNNTITVGKKDELARSEFFVDDINLFYDAKSFECEVKIRYRSPKVACKFDVEQKKVTLKSPVYGIADGQRAVFYEGEKVVASGEIV